MAQPPPDQNFYHHTLPHPHPHAHPHSHTHSHAHTQHPQLQLPPQFRNPFDLLFDERTGAINYNYIRPYLPNQMPKPDELSDSLVMRRPRRTRTTFTSSQIAELEQHFLQGRYLTAPRLADLSAKLALGTAQVKIWFKNRRRRHKIQSDQHKDQSYDGMPLSPSMPNAPLKSTDADPPSLQALSLGGGSATPNALTPSPTPSTPTAHLVEHYNESFNAYYNYSNHHSQATGQQRHAPQPQYNAASQFFPGAGAMQQHGNPHGQQQLHQQQAGPPPLPPHHQQSHQQLHHHHVMAQQQQQQQQQHQQQQQQQQQQYHHFDFQQKNTNGCRVPVLKGDNEAEYSFNGSYYMRTTALPLAGVAANMPAVESVTSALSPGSEVYEPLTPKNDESPSLCGGGPSGGVGVSVGGTGSGGGVGGPCATAVGADDVTDDMDDGSTKKTTTTLQNLEPLKSNNGVADKTCDDGSDVLSAGLLAVARGNLMGCGSVSNGNSAFGKFGKLTVPSTQAPPLTPSEAMNEANQYQCTMDTIMQAYNPHRNATGNTQFAYCFN
ncbi:hypothetical protein ACLKA6_003556 [Drosophila palustris]